MNIDQRIYDTLLRWGGDYRWKAETEILFKTWEQFDEFCRALLPTEARAQYAGTKRVGHGGVTYDIPELMHEAVTSFGAAADNATPVAHFIRLMHYAEHGVPWALAQDREKLEAFLEVPLDYAVPALPDHLDLWTRDEAVTVFHALGEYAREGVPAAYVRDLQLDDTAVYRKAVRGLAVYRAGVDADYAYNLMMWGPDSVILFAQHQIPVEYIDNYQWPLTEMGLTEQQLAESVVGLHGAGVPTEYGVYGMKAAVPATIIIECWYAGLPTEYMAALTER